MIFPCLSAHRVRLKLQSHRQLCATSATVKRRRVWVVCRINDFPMKEHRRCWWLHRFEPRLPHLNWDSSLRIFRISRPVDCLELDRSFTNRTDSLFELYLLLYFALLFLSKLLLFEGLDKVLSRSTMKGLQILNYSTAFPRYLLKPFQSDDFWNFM